MLRGQSTVIENSPDLPITVLMNAGSGSADADASRRAIEAALADMPRDTALRIARRPGELGALAREAAETRPGILAAAGGDGTLNTVVAVAVEHGLPFGVIPLGTFNYFAREHGIPLDADAATRLIAAGRIRREALGRVNGRPFLINASIGLYRRLIEQREAHKRRFGRNRFVALLSGLSMLLREHRPYRVRMQIDGQPVTLSTLTVFFGRSAMQMAQLGLDEAECVSRGELGVLALREVGRGELFALALRGALARLETAENLRQYCALEVEIDWLNRKSHKIRVAVDGELIACSLPLVIESVPDALMVVVPPEAAGAT